MDTKTYEYIDYSEKKENTIEVIGLISSYNVNTYKGRIYDLHEKRPIPFEISENIRTAAVISLITQSLSANATKNEKLPGLLWFKAYSEVSKTGIVKRYFIVDIRREERSQVIEHLRELLS